MSDDSNYELLRQAEEKMEQHVHNSWHDPLLAECIRLILEVVRRRAGVPKHG